MMIEVFRFLMNTGPVLWFGNLTNPYPIRYVYRTEEIDSDLQDE